MAGDQDIAPADGFLGGGGALGALMRGHDWAATPLGAAPGWPQSLRSVTALILGSRFPMFLAWGPALSFLYNDAYAELLGAKHPAALGAPFRQVWGEIWPDIEPLIDAALAGHASYHEDLPLVLHRRGYDEQTWFTFSYSPVRAESGAVAGLFCATHETTGRVLAERALRESEEDLRHAAELNPQVTWSARPDGQLDRVSPRWMEWTGLSGLGSGYGDALHPEDLAATGAQWRRSVDTGRPYDILHRVRRTDGELRWIRSRAYPRRDEAGAILRWYGTTEDVHEQKAAEDHLRLMVLELNHRVKNSLATAQSIAVQTLRGSATPLEARQAFEERLTALAAAHDILTRGQWEGADLGEVARVALAPLGGAGERVRLDGPAVRLEPKAALAFSMAFHELATNALKYGALSAPGGRVVLDWTADAEHGLALTWREEGGPPVAPPARRGFGSRLLEKGLAAELKGEVALAFEPEGLACRIRAPLPGAEGQTAV